jgi:hypothetical protein
MSTQAVVTGWGMPAAVKTAYGYLILDIETRNAPEEVVKKEFEAVYRAPSNYKDKEKLKSHRAEAWAKCLEKSALQPSAPIPAIGLKSETELRCLHCMWEHAPSVRMNGLVEGFADEASMLNAFCALLATKADTETIIGGFNIKWFDLPAIRRALARRKMPIPDALLNPDQPVFDNMEKWCRMYAGERDIMASAPQVSMGLGIEPHKVSGAVVPELFANGEYELVIDKVMLDVLEEEEQFLRMTGRTR